VRIIGVLSDTHMIKIDEAFIDLFSHGPFKELETFIHAGDFTSVKVVEYLERFVFYGVQGNMDDFFVKKRLPEKRVVTIDGMNIGITHGWGAPFDLARRVYEYFENPALDCIVFGHSHKPTNHRIGKTLMFNPGSFKHSLISPARTVGTLRIENGRMTGEILKLRAP